MPPSYVKRASNGRRATRPIRKRSAKPSRPTIRFVGVKSVDQQPVEIGAGVGRADLVHSLLAAAFAAHTRKIDRLLTSPAFDQAETPFIEFAIDEV